MAKPGRSSDTPHSGDAYPDDQYPGGRGRPSGAWPSARRTGAQVRPEPPQEEDPWPGPPWGTMSSPPGGAYPTGAHPSGPFPAGAGARPSGARPAPSGAYPAPGPRTTGAWPTAQATQATPTTQATQATKATRTDAWQTSRTAAPQTPEMPPPEWADPAVGRRWTSSWRVRETRGQPTLPAQPPSSPPQWPDPPPRREMGGFPRRGDSGGYPVQATGPQPTEPTAPWETAGPGGDRGSAATRTLDTARAPGVSRSTGSMRAVKPIAPGTGRARIVWPILVLAIILLGGIGVFSLWWSSKLPLNSEGNLLISIGDILGLAAGYGVVILVALMARLPPLEKAIGTDRLARWHATGGRWTISTVSGHVVFIVWGYSVTGQKNVPSEVVTMLTTFPDILMATVAWILLLSVAAFSMRAARRRLSYETWYYAHLYTYLAIALAFSHQFADGGTFSQSFRARVAWSALYAVVGGLLIWYRIITPLLRSRRHQFTVQSVRAEAPGIVSVFITGRDFDRLRAEPGQFFRWRFLTKELWWQSHPYSLSAMPQPDLIRITVKARGDHSGSLALLRPGTRIIAEGPYGAFTPSLTGRRVLFIAGGVGITPIRAMFAALPRRMAGGITLLYRASHPRDVVFSRELNAIATDRDAALHYLIGSREELGFDPLDADHLQQTVPGLHRYEVYVCGPTGMTQAAVNALVAAGIPRRRIHHESFDL